MSEIHVFILAGGSGTRLWPLSTQKRPKQFCPFLKGNRTPFEESVKRARAVAGDNVWIVTGRPFAHFIKEFSPEVEDEKVLLEPFPRNTAGAIAWALQASRIKDDDMLVIMPSDHYIEPEDVFVREVGELARFCGSRFIGLLGVQPYEPSTSFGYILPGDEVENGIFMASSFKEKPDEETARKLIERGALWNTGIFVLSTGLAKESLCEYSRFHAEFFKKVEEGVSPSRAFAELPAAQFDRLVLEKAHNLVLLRAEFSWSDLGTWDALIRGGFAWRDGDPVFLLDAQSSVAISADGRPVAVVGVNDVIVVSGEDGVLVLKRGKSAEVKHALSMLKRNCEGGS